MTRKTARSARKDLSTLQTRTSGEETELISVRFFRADVDKLRTEAKRTNVPWHQRLRLLVRAALRGRRVAR